MKMGTAYNNLGIYYWKIDNYCNSALKLNEKALEVARSANKPQNEADCLHNIGLVYRDMGNYEKALDYFSEGTTS